MGKKTPPAAPDPVKTAQAQTQQSIDTAIANNTMGMVNQRGPDGSLSYNIIGYETDPSTGRQIPRYEAVTALSEANQKLRDASNAANLNLSNLAVSQSGRLEGLLSKPMDMNSVPGRADWSGMKPAEYGADLSAPDYQDFSGDAGLTDTYDVGDTKRYEDALMARMQPQLEQDRQRLETNLANRGIRDGTARDRALDEINRSQNDARMAAILNAGQEQTRLAGIARDKATFGNTARQQTFQNTASTTAANNSNRSQGFADRQAIQGRSDANANNRFSQLASILDAQDRSRAGALQEQYAQRNQPINEISALLSGSQVATPNFNIATPDRMQTTDVAGITQQGYANQMAAYQQKMANLNNTIGAISGLGSAFLMGPAGGMFGLGARTN